MAALKAAPVIEPNTRLKLYISSVKANIVDPQLLPPDR